MLLNFKVLSFGLILLLVAAGCTANDQQQISSSPYTTPLRVGDQQIFVEVVNTDATRMQGLSDREPLTDEQGMLFDFRNTGINQPGFWMKDMKFNLDLIWIKDNKIIGITPDVPAPQSPTDPLPNYSPPGPIDQVLEVKAGWSAKHNIKIGDELKI